MHDLISHNKFFFYFKHLLSLTAGLQAFSGIFYIHFTRIFSIWLLSYSIWFYTHNDSVNNFSQSAMLCLCAIDQRSWKQQHITKQLTASFAVLLLRMAVAPGMACNWTMTISHTPSVDSGHSPPLLDPPHEVSCRDHSTADIHDIRIPTMSTNRPDSIPLRRVLLRGCVLKWTGHPPTSALPVELEVVLQHDGSPEDMTDVVEDSPIWPPWEGRSLATHYVFWNPEAFRIAL